MTIPDIARQLLKAAAIGKTSHLLPFCLVNAIKSVDLSRDMNWLAGGIEVEVGIEFAGLRTGERFHAGLLADAGTSLRMKLTKVRIVNLGTSASDGVLSVWVTSVVELMRGVIDCRTRSHRQAEDDEVARIAL